MTPHNYTDYTKSLQRSLKDKADFILNSKCKYFIDFGCADGTLLNYIQERLAPQAGYNVAVLKYNEISKKKIKK